MVPSAVLLLSPLTMVIMKGTLLHFDANRMMPAKDAKVNADIADGTADTCCAVSKAKDATAVLAFDQKSLFF